MNMLRPVRSIAPLLLALLSTQALAANGSRIHVQDVTPVISLPLSALAARGVPMGMIQPHEVENHRLPLSSNLARRPQHEDAVMQTRLPAVRLATSAGVSFPGIGQSTFGFSVDAAPPDTTGAVGTTQYVQWVNTAIAVFDKSSGALLAGPFNGSDLFAGLGATHPCASHNDGDPLVLFDRRAQRWVLSQFSVAGPYYQCVAVSTTDDATGTYALYAFRQPNFNDYGKLGIWNDAYYIAYNMFAGSSYVGARACAMRRAGMIAGTGSRQVCFDTSANDGGLLPADLDGATRLPPTGTPEYFVSLDLDTQAGLKVWRFHADFATPANSTFTGPDTVPVAAFTLPCITGGDCVKQPNSLQQLDTLGDRLMYRLAYRRRGTVESLLVNHAVKAGSSVGIRWYELRAGAGVPTLAQQSTFAPDATYRWMGSIAMDRAGDIALGYSASSSTVFPSIRYAGRRPSDPAGTLLAENSMLEGTGSQKASLDRWGDYSTLVVDPVDDCTFWYTNEYLQSSGTFNWHTQIGSFKFGRCT